MGGQPMTEQQNPAGRILRDISHGGEVLADEAKNARAVAAAIPGISLASDAVPGVDIKPDPATSPFNYLFDTLVNDPDAHLPADDPAAVVAALTTLGRALVEAPSTD